jgi:LacI family transcriptional regulator
LPLVLINRRLDHLPCSSVTSNDREAAYACVSPLIGEGRRRIAAVTGLPGIYTTQERLAGYHLALEAAGLEVDPALEVSGHAHLEGGYQVALTLMQRPNPPDALFVFNNFMTQGVVIALQDLGVRWPDRIDVAGFGAFKTARLYRPPLTLIDQPAYKIGERAVEMLIDKIEGQTEAPPEVVVLQNRLITRETWLNQAASLDHGPAER